MYGYDYFKKDLPIISGILITLSKAKPVKNLHKAKLQNADVCAVAIDANNATPLQRTRAGIRPLWSAIHPNIKPPVIEPQKNMACAVDIKYSLSHTQSN